MGLNLRPDRFLLLDGAMGTQLLEAGLGLGERPELLCFTRPALVEEIHRRYLDAGSGVIYANTFGANAHKLAGCGHSHKAESTVKDFLEKNVSASEYTVAFTKTDSTRHVTDSAVIEMRKDAERNPIFKKGIAYDSATVMPEKYVYTKAEICVGGDTIAHTFYLNPEENRIVAFKRQNY